LALGALSALSATSFSATALALVDLLHAVHQRATLYRYAAIVLGDLRVGLKDLRRHVQLQGQLVTGRPFAANRQVLTRNSASDRFTVDADLRVVAPPGNANIEGNSVGCAGVTTISVAPSQG